MKKSFTYTAWYKDGYDIEVVDNNEKAGAFTEFKDGSLHLSDGEEAVFSLRIKNENAKGKITGLTWTPSENKACSCGR